jgi:hypothetical protein
MTMTPDRQAAETLFEVSFATAMDDHDLAVLARGLDLYTNPRTKASPHDEDLGFARLDYASGVFLRRSTIEGEWILQARTWGHPAATTVHGWHVLATEVARQLDPTVSVPDRTPATASLIPDRRVGRAANSRMADFRRRLVGLS